MKGKRPINRMISAHGYKTAIALLFGLTAAWWNLHPWQIGFDFHRVAFYPGMMLPLTVSLAWGWRYGALSALLGLACATPCISLFPVHGAMSLLLTATFVLWIMWHGWCAGRGQWRLAACRTVFTAEIPFRICGSAGLYLFYWLETQFGAPARTTVSGLSALPLVHLTVIGQALGGYVTLLLSIVILNLGSIRTLLRLKSRVGQKTTTLLISAAVLLGLVFWVADGIFDYYKYRETLRYLIFEGPENILDSIALKVTDSALFARSVFIITCLNCGLLLAMMMRKRLEGEQALRQSEQRYRRLHETMRDAFVELDMAGTIVDSNSAYRDMVGYCGHELQTKKHSDLMPAHEQDPYRRILARQVLTTGKSDVFETTYLRKDRTFFPVELRIFLITDDQNLPTGMWAIARDITARIQVESEREQALSDLKRSNEDLQQFAYVASHDLQEPLRMVSSYTQLLAQRYENQLDDKARKYINYAVDGAVRMQSLIQDLLTYSRVDTRGDSFQPTDTLAALKSALANLRAIIDESGAVVTWEPLPWIKGDPMQICQVFQNLISNSVKFRSAALPFIHVTALRLNHMWRISVSDNGIGIPKPYQERVFIIFKRLHTQEEYPGTGIGLALCKRIVQRHHGDIWVESDTGRGATVHFTLPACAEEYQDDEEQHHNEANRHLVG